MKKNFTTSILTILAMMASWGCESETIEISGECAYTAVVEDWTGLDGCGFLFKLDDGEYLEPVWRWGWCGTPPLPDGATEDPLWNFEFKDGQRVRLGFERTNEYFSVCMKGNMAIITCLEVIDNQPWHSNH